MICTSTSRRFVWLYKYTFIPIYSSFACHEAYFNCVNAKYVRSNLRTMMELIDDFKNMLVCSAKITHSKLGEQRQKVCLPDIIRIIQLRGAKNDAYNSPPSQSSTNISSTAVFGKQNSSFFAVDSMSIKFLFPCTTR